MMRFLYTAKSNMTPRLSAAAFLIAAWFLLPVHAAAQGNIDGMWTNATLTPFERPPELAGKPFFTPEEASKFEQQARERNNADRREATADADLTTGYNDFWWDRGTKVAST